MRSTLYHILIKKNQAKTLISYTSLNKKIGANSLIINVLAKSFIMLWWKTKARVLLVFPSYLYIFVASYGTYFCFLSWFLTLQSHIVQDGHQRV